MFQQMVACRACQRDFLITTEHPDQLEVRCPLCGLTLVYPDRPGLAGHPPDEIVLWNVAPLDCG